MFKKNKIKTDAAEKEKLEPLMREPLDNEVSFEEETQEEETRNEDSQSVENQSDETQEDETQEAEPQEDETAEEEKPTDETEVKIEAPDNDSTLTLEQAYCMGAGIDNETLEKAKSVINRMAETVSSRRFDPEILQMALRLLNYEKDLEDARTAGRNQEKTDKMAEAFRNKRKAAEEAAAIPHLGGSRERRGLPKGSIFDIAREGGW